MHINGIGIHTFFSRNVVGEKGSETRVTLLGDNNKLNDVKSVLSSIAIVTVLSQGTKLNITSNRNIQLEIPFHIDGSPQCGIEYKIIYLFSCSNLIKKL